MLIPDYNGAYSALDAHERPVASLGELTRFMQSMGERVDAGRVYAALLSMQFAGSVIAVHSWGRPPRYALRKRLEFRRALPPTPTSGPWAS